MTSKVLCKYYQSGCCVYGDNCRFSHDKGSDAPSQVCRYYLAGNCAYGDNCRYEHAKPGWSAAGQPPPPSNYRPPAGPRPHMGPPPPPPAAYGRQQGQQAGPPAGAAYMNAQGQLVQWPSGADEFGLLESNDPNPNWNDYMDPDEMDEWEAYQQQEQEFGEDGLEFLGSGDSIVDPADIPLCSEYASQGQCRKGDACPLIHGDECEMCHQYLIHPYNPEQIAQHRSECPAREKANGVAAAAASAPTSASNGIAEGTDDTSAAGEGPAAAVEEAGVTEAAEPELEAGKADEADAPAEGEAAVAEPASVEDTPASAAGEPGAGAGESAANPPTTEEAAASSSDTAAAADEAAEKLQDLTVDK